MSGTDIEEPSSAEVVSAPSLATVSTKLPASASVAVTRSTRRRSSNVQVYSIYFMFVSLSELLFLMYHTVRTQL